MSWFSDLDEILGRYEEYRDRETAKHQASKFDALADRLEDIAEKIQIARRHERHLGVARNQSQVSWGGVLSDLAQLEQDLRKDLDINIQALRAKCDASETVLMEECRRDWIAWIEEHKVNQLEPSVLSRLRLLDEDAVEELESLQRQRAALVRKAYAGEGDVEFIRTLGTRVADALARLGFDDGEVQRGFQQLVAGGVSLEELSGEDSKLRKWLQDKGLFGICKVSL